MQALKKVLNALNQKNQSDYNDYYIPSLWMKSDDSPGIIRTNPFELYTSIIENIINADEIDKPKSKNELITYNLFIRFATAFDHDNNGSISNKKGGFNECGTFLKSIALLNYLRYLGINTIYMLPITSIGTDRKKGDLGSPYAIKDPYKIDENLSEDILGLDVETQFAAFVEAAHKFGINVVCEFVFRTASVDSDLALQHPDWFYWIPENIADRPAGSNDKNKYGPPIFTPKEMKEIKKQIEACEREKLVPPHPEYRKMFKDTPVKVVKQNNKIIGFDKDNNRLRIPGAFADWPPDDSQPVWSDVTYLKLFDHKGFNYIAYNTVRMYDSKLNKARFRINPLWEYIKGIVPYYIKNFDIDGIMIDMGHSLPTELRQGVISKAIAGKPDFILWEENFLLERSSADEGYDAVLGYMPFDSHVPEKMKNMLERIGKGAAPINFFATPESHNTPRAASRKGGTGFAKAAYLIAAFMQSMPFIHNGFELGESIPVNTGLGFEKEEYEKYPPEILPLFSTASINWLNEDNLITYIHFINELRRKYSPNKGINAKNLVVLNTQNTDVIAFLIRNDEIQKEILIAANLSDKYTAANIDLCYGVDYAYDEFTGDNIYTKEGVMHYEFHPFRCFAAVLNYKDNLIDG